MCVCVCVCVCVCGYDEREKENRERENISRYTWYNTYFDFYISHTVKRSGYTLRKMSQLSSSDEETGLCNQFNQPQVEWRSVMC